jgi:hypothetical protein
MFLVRENGTRSVLQPSGWQHFTRSSNPRQR